MGKSKVRVLHPNRNPDFNTGVYSECTVHLADIADFATFNQVYTSFFGDIKPARTTVQSVMAENIKVEIDAIVRYTKDK